MVWRDLDYGVDAAGCTAEQAWETMLPLLVRCDALRYELDAVPPARFYYVVRLGGWKLDMSIWSEPMPADVEAFQQRLLGRLDDATRLTILRLKEAWWRRPEYPEQVSAWEIYDAVLEHGARTPAELDAYLAERQSTP